MDIQFKQEAQKQLDYAVNMRRYFHMNPELSGEEVKTSAQICKELAQMDIPFTVIEQYSVVGLVDTGSPGKTVAVRADIDALPVQEENAHAYKSTVDGKMHACGHDGHAAILLATAKAIIQNIKQFCGKIYLCFQLGEETGKGAGAIVEYLKEQGGVDSTIALHLTALLDRGFAFLPDKEVCAGAADWRLTVNGQGGHGSQPHLAIDPIKPLCEILPRFTSMAVNRVDPFSPVVISPCIVKAGNIGNVIPDNAFAQGTIRFYSAAVLDDVVKMMKEISACIAKSYGASAKVDIFTKPLIPVINNQNAARVGRQAAEEMGITCVQMTPPMTSDNYALFLDAFPGFYCILAAGDSAKGINKANHHPSFDINEDAMADGVEFFLRCLEKML